MPLRPSSKEVLVIARILVVESQPKVQLLLRTLLEEEGHEVIATSDGYKAVELFAKNPANMVICNLLNPSRNGLQTTEKIKAINPFTPVIILSGSDMINEVDYLQAVHKIKVQATLAKPFDIINLFKWVNLLLSE